MSRHSIIVAILLGLCAFCASAKSTGVPLDEGLVVFNPFASAVLPVKGKLVKPLANTQLLPLKAVLACQGPDTQERCTYVDDESKTVTGTCLPQGGSKGLACIVPKASVKPKKR